MEKDLNDKLKQEKLSYFRSKEYRGEQLKVIMDAIDYGIGTDYLQLFDDTAIPAGIMKNMLTAMKEDYGVQEAAFLSAVRQEESGRILLEALKSGVPLPELQAAYRDGMFPIELREKILPLMQGREAIPEKIGEKMEFITEAVRELKESFSRQNSFIEDLKKAMEDKPDIFSVQEKGTEADTEVDPYYLELEEQFRQAREDAERLLEEREETVRRLRELEAENKNLHEQLLAQKSYMAGLQEKQAAQESRNIQEKQKPDSSPEIKNCQRQETGGAGNKKQDSIEADTAKSAGTPKIPETYRMEVQAIQMQGTGEPALLQKQDDLPVGNTSTSHIQKRNAGDSIRQRGGDISGRKDGVGRKDKKSKKDKGKDKDAKKDKSRSNSKKRKDRAAAFRLLSYVSDKFSQEEQKDSLLKVAKDLLAGKAKAAVAGKLLSIGASLLPALIPAFIVTVIITLLFNSPFSILLPKLSEESGAVEVLAEYTEDFREKVQEELADPGSGDETELIYEDYEGDGEPDNMADILMVYMVKHGFGDTATVMTEKNRRALKDTFDEMTSMSTSYRREVVEQSYEEEDFYGNVTIRTEEVEIKIKEVRITLLTSEDIIRTGIFTEEETEILRYLMSPEVLENIEGLAGGYGSPGAGSLTPEEAERLNLGGDVGSQAVKNALARLGKPYSQAKRDSGDYYDCSSLTYYAYKEAGITLSYHGSNTAASQGQLLSDRGCEVAYEDIQPGDLIFYSFTRNGRYKNISHVAVYAGNGYLVDASSAKGCVVFRPVYFTGKIVMCGRPSWL